MKTAVLAIAALMLIGCVHTTAVSSNSGLVGTWRLVDFWDADGEGQPKRYPFGEHPLGFFVYDSSGNVFIQIARNPTLSRMTSREWHDANRDELVATLEGYVAYFGTYTVDAARSVVIHHVAADVRREYTGTDQERPFRLTGDELVIGDGKTWLRRLIRVK